jgi:hypothetical protein
LSAQQWPYDRGNSEYAAKHTLVAAALTRRDEIADYGDRCDD